MIPNFRKGNWAVSFRSQACDAEELSLQCPNATKVKTQIIWKLFENERYEEVRNEINPFSLFLHFGHFEPGIFESVKS